MGPSQVFCQKKKKITLSKRGQRFSWTKFSSDLETSITNRPLQSMTKLINHLWQDNVKKELTFSLQICILISKSLTWKENYRQPKHREIALQFSCDQVSEGNCCLPHYCEPNKFMYPCYSRSEKWSSIYISTRYRWE